MNTESQIAFQRAKQERLTRFNPIRNLTAEKLSSDIDSFNVGYLAPFARLMDAIKRRDDVLRVVAPKREGAPSRRDWQILTLSNLTEGSEQEAERHKAALEFFYNNLNVTSAVNLNLRGGVRLLIKQILTAIGFEYAVHHIVWKPEADGLTAELIYCPLWFFESRTGKLRFIQSEFSWDGEEMEEGAWLVAVCEDYVMEACAVAYMFKHLPLKDWLIFSQDFGKPVVEGISDAPEGSTEWNALKAAVEALAADLRIIRSRSAEIKLTDINRSGDQPYGPLVDRMDRALSRLWRGADLSTISGANDSVGSNLQGSEKDQMESDDAQFASETCQLGLDKWVIEYIFGPGVKPLAYFKIIVPERKDLTQEVAVDTFLRDSQAPMGVRATLERYNRTLPDADEELLTRPATPALAPLAQEAANENQLNAELVQNALAEAMGVRAKWLAPVRKLIEELVAKLQDESISDQALIEFMDRAAQRVPELFGKMDVMVLRDSLEAALGSAAIDALRQSLRNQPATDNRPLATVK